MGRDALTRSDSARRRRQAHLWLAAVLGGLGMAAVLLDRVPPGVSRIYPACPFRALTGLLCPGCGATHAVATLIHGQLAEAMRWNGLVVALLVIVGAWAGAAYLRAVRGLENAWPRVPPMAILASCICVAVFGALRNLA